MHLERLAVLLSFVACVCCVSVCLYVCIGIVCVYIHVCVCVCSAGEAGASASGNSSSKAAVLSAALPFVPQHGWSRQAVVEGSKVAGIPLAGLSGIGAGDLVGFFEEKSNDEVVQYMKQQLESQEEDKK